MKLLVPLTVLSILAHAGALPTIQTNDEVDLAILTNGERLARGLKAIRKPVRTYDASRISSARRATVSGVSIPAGQPTTFNGKTYVNKGLVAFGIIPADAKDSLGETLGGIGSAIDFVPGSWKRSGVSNVYTGTLITQPDRGHNTDTTIDYNTRQQLIDVTITPYYDTAAQTFAQGKSTATLTYKSTLLYNAFGAATSGLDALGTIPARPSNPVEPAPGDDYLRLSTDLEGLIANEDGSFWVSDEYGPYIWKFSAAGELLQTIQPPKAVLPYVNGEIQFSSNTAPMTGRSPNQGFESLTISGDGKTLYAMLQSGAVQDGGDSNRFSRLLGWDISIAEPVLTSHYVVVLPVTNGKGKTIAVSEFKWLSETNGKPTFVLLSRDGKGMGDDDSESKHKDFLLVNTAGATNLVGTQYSDDIVPVASKSILAAGVTAIYPSSWIDIIDTTQLARFGLHNGGAFDESLIGGKWESIAIASCYDPLYPSDYFLFSLSDNDFITSSGFAVGKSYQDAYGKEVNTQLLVWRVTLPSDPQTKA